MGSGLLRLKLMIAGMLCRLAAKHNRAVEQCSLGVPVQVYPVASAWQLATAPMGVRLGGTVTGIGNTTRSECTKIVRKQSNQLG